MLSPTGMTPSLREWVGHFFSYIQKCFDVARERRQLLSLDDEVLKDIGVSRADAVREAGRSFWNIDERC